MPSARLSRLPLFVAAFACLQTTVADAADLLLVNGRVFTAAAPKWAEAIAITGDRIEKVGTTVAATMVGGKIVYGDLR